MWFCVLCRGLLAGAGCLCFAPCLGKLKITSRNLAALCPACIISSLGPRPGQPRTISPSSKSAHTQAEQRSSCSSIFFHRHFLSVIIAEGIQKKSKILRHIISLLPLKCTKDSFLLIFRYYNSVEVCCSADHYEELQSQIQWVESLTGQQMRRKTSILLSKGQIV